MAGAGVAEFAAVAAATGAVKMGFGGGEITAGVLLMRPATLDSAGGFSFDRAGDCGNGRTSHNAQTKMNRTIRKILVACLRISEEFCVSIQSRAFDGLCNLPGCLGCNIRVK
jgi:hypothetical protein